MGAKERSILFIHSDGATVHSVPLDSYIPGDIQKTKQMLAHEMNCSPMEIRVKMTGIRNGRPKKPSSLPIHLIDGKALRDFFE